MSCALLHAQRMPAKSCQRTRMTCLPSRKALEAQLLLVKPETLESRVCLCTGRGLTKASASCRTAYAGSACMAGTCISPALTSYAFKHFLASSDLMQSGSKYACLASSVMPGTFVTSILHAGAVHWLLPLRATWSFVLLLQISENDRHS